MARGVSVRQAMSDTDSEEFAEWIAFGATDPWWSARDDMRTALVCAVVANAHRAKGKPFELSDFMLAFGRKPRQTQTQIKAAMTQWAELHNRSKKHGATH